MLGFLLKKTFFDLWDNILRVALLNLGFIASAAFPVFVPRLFPDTPVLGIAAMLAGILWCFVYLMSAALCLRKISDYGSFGVADFFGNIKAAWPAGLVMGGLVFALALLTIRVIPFYAGLESMTGILLSALVFWVLVAGILSLQFFPAVRARMDTKITTVIKKCFMFFFDNPGFGIITLLHNLVLLAISALLLFLMPGPAGILLFLDEALRLRLLKYGYLEANPKANRRKIPWDTLLTEEREKTGTRSLKSLIFPWKD